VEGESTCLNCHRGTGLNAAGGNVTVAFPGSFTYTPGVRQRLRVTLSDSSGGDMGYQVTARRADDPRQAAGSFVVPAAVAGGGFGPGMGGPPPAGGVPVARSRVTCWNGDLEADDTPKPAAGCPSTSPIESVTHSNSVVPTSTATATWEFDFVPPDTPVGPIKIYVAGNSVRGPEERNSRPYTAVYQLDPVNPVMPRIESISVDEAFGIGTTFRPGTWLNIVGTSLAATIRSWNDADFTNNIAPTSMDSVVVRIGGQPRVRFGSQ
jgi:hypothetical protein